MNNTPKANRPHIAFIGSRNAGKSSLINALIGQQLSIVSDTPGTTTDPVEKAYELQPAGPVVIIDTAGIDDLGDLGSKRGYKTREVVKRSDVVVVVISTEMKLDNLTDSEEYKLVSQLKRDKQILLVLNKSDLINEQDNDIWYSRLKELFDISPIIISAEKEIGIDQTRAKLVELISELTPDPPIIADLATTPESVVLVIPIDKEAPKGRLILPQVQTIRELLDADIPCTVVKERELHYTLHEVLKQKPKIVVTDSQAFQKVDADVPEDILLTSFSILFARQKGDLQSYVDGVKRIERLKDGDRILIAESCSHRPISEDIGRVKIPRWLKSYTGKKLEFEVSAGKQFPDDLSKYKLIIQCGGCMVNRTLIMSRISEAGQKEVAITNYGITIAFLKGILPRALKLFPEIHI
jgi:[FeFe] hydrogenase H-cluster maturation GTPase HydF